MAMARSRTANPNKLAKWLNARIQQFARHRGRDGSKCHRNVALFQASGSPTVAIGLARGQSAWRLHQMMPGTTRLPPEVGFVPPGRT
jgi:hypothetical protein